MAKKQLYPTKITQPNANKSSGLNKYYFKAVESKNRILEVRHDVQKDPKYYHAWTNPENLLSGKEAQCGRRSSHHCSHATYYSITGYRNTCPIAGLSGTYTQPAALRLYFSPKKKNIPNNAEINSVTLTFKHRRVGVDVANDKIYTSWGPNFSGYDVYPKRKVLKVTFAGETIEYNKNPPLSKNDYSEVTFKFKKVKFKDLNDGYIEIQYGNNLSTNPGNIYVKGLSINVDYDAGTPYIEGTQSSPSLYTAQSEECMSNISFNLEAGYKQGKKKISVKKAPKALNNLIKITTPNNKIEVFDKHIDNDKKTFTFKIRDKTNKEGKKTIVAEIKGESVKKEFTYEAIKSKNPSISFPKIIEHNTKPSPLPLVIKNDCTRDIKVYDDNLNTLIFHFTSNDFNNDNSIKQNKRTEFYKKIATKLKCGVHKLIFKMNNQTIYHWIQIVPTQYEFKFIYNNQETNFIELNEDHSTNTTVDLIFIKNNKIYEDTNLQPKFKIINPTYKKGSDNSPVMVTETDEIWNTATSPTKNIIIGRYVPGDYKIKITEDNSLCAETPKELSIKINPDYHINFDSIFVRGEDSTAFDYEYLVALEGDAIQKPIYVEELTLGTSFNDIKICAEENNMTGLSQIQPSVISITNTSEEEVNNLLLEMNLFTLDDDDNPVITTEEWYSDDGMFKDFYELFKEYNKDLEEIVSIKNLTPDNDLVDEENVYIYIKNIKPNKTLSLNIPYKTFVEKTVYLQFFLFEQPLTLYQAGNGCPNETDTFSYMKFIVYDSILTDMSISGETDVLETNDVNCPLECFKMENEGITYSIKNIDTSSTGGLTQTIIKNDAKLIPYKIMYQDEEYSEEGDFGNIEVIQNNNATKSILLRNVEVYCDIKFITEIEEPITESTENEEENTTTTRIEITEEKHTVYTDANGEATFFVTIPEYMENNYTVEDFDPTKSICQYHIDYGKTINERAANKEFRNKYGKDSRESNVEVIKDFISYSPGQVIPVKIRCTGTVEYIQNEILFSADINNPGDEDSLTVYYKACNLDNNEGILTTSFATNKNAVDFYKVVPNEVKEDIYFGVETDLCPITKLEKIIVENNTVNRLHITLNNRKRWNKDVKITIEEQGEEKYNYLQHEIEFGNVYINDNTIEWVIDKLEKNSIIKGYFDFKAKKVGKSTFKIDVTDFIHNDNSSYIFGEDSYKCECRKNS